MASDGDYDLPEHESGASRKILQLIREGNPNGWHIAHRRYSAGMLAIARRRLIKKENAEGVVQDVWERMLDKLRNEPDDAGKLGPYLAQFVRNLVANRNAKTKRRRQWVDTCEVPMEDFGDPAGRTALQGLEWVDVIAEVHTAIGELNERDQDILRSYYFSQESRHDIATRWQLDKIQFAKSLSRARLRLKNKMAGLNNDE